MGVIVIFDALIAVLRFYQNIDYYFFIEDFLMLVYEVNGIVV